MNSKSVDREDYKSERLLKVKRSISPQDVY